MDFASPYPNIQHEKDIASPCKIFETRDSKQISRNTLMALAEVVLKNNIFEYDEKIFKQKSGTVIGIKFAPPYDILYIADFEKEMFHPKIKFTAKYSKWEVNFLDINIKLSLRKFRTDAKRGYLTVKL